VGKLRPNNLNSLKNESIKTLQLPGITNLDVLKPCDHLELTNPNYHSNNNLMLLHQGIRSLNNKIDEFSNFTSTNPPQLLYFSEHPLKSYQLDKVLIQSYNLGAKFCRNIFKNGGVCISTHGSIHFSGINVFDFCKEKDLEACAIKVHFAFLYILYFCHI
jgi:hypothetical protein